jgi:hypothetical protein
MQKKIVLTHTLAQAMPLVRKFVVAIGIGLTLSSIRFDIWKIRQGVGQNYWSSWTTRVLLIGLVAICGLLLIANVWREERERFMASISGLGAILLGYFLFVPVADGGFGNLLIGPKLSVAGSALIVLGALPVRSLRSRQRPRKRAPIALSLTWLLAVIGPALAIVALERDASVLPITSPSNVLMIGPHPTYWKSVGLSGGHALGILMLALAALAIVLAVADVALRAPVLGRWALGASLVLFGTSLWYPVSLADLSTIGTGGGLALEGSLLAVSAGLVAVSVERGALALTALDLRRLAAVAGIGLALAGVWTNIWRQAGSSFWTDGTAGGAPFILVVAAAVLLALGFVYRRKLVSAIASVIGWALAGYFAFYIAERAPNYLGSLGPATWLGLAGGVLLGLSTVSPRAIAGWRRRTSPLTPRRLAAWLATGVGTAVVLGSLWFDLEAPTTYKQLYAAVFGTNAPAKAKDKVIHLSYWNCETGHSLGIVMIVLGGITLVALVGTLITKLSILRAWAVAASLALFGISLYIPASEAFHHLGVLRDGAWMAFAGSLVAIVGAVTLALSDLPSEESVEEEPEKTPKTARAPHRGRGRRVPETRRA